MSPPSAAGARTPGAPASLRPRAAPLAFRLAPRLAVALVALSLAIPPHLAAQETPGVDGRATDPEGRPIRALTVVLLPAGSDAPLRTTETDETGYFRITPLEPGSYLVRFLRIGFFPAEESILIRPGERARVDPVLSPSPVILSTIEAEGTRSRARARFEDVAGVTSRELTIEEIRWLPGLAEADPLRAVEILPGVISPSDFSASFSVRGGSGDQNLILLDGFPLYNPFHLGGVFSVFNGDMVDRVELQSGGFPARFGGRVSSVLRVESDPGPGSLTVEGGVSLLAARVAVSGGVSPGIREALGLTSARWRLSGRRSYIDQLVRPFTDLPYHIRDLQGFAEGWTPGGSRITLTGYTGRDVLDLGRLSNEDFPLRVNWDWGNDLAGVRWTRGFPDGGIAEAGVGLTRFSTSLSFPDFDDSLFRSEVVQLSLFGSGERWLRAGWKGSVGGGLDRYTYDNFASAGGTTFSRGKGTGVGTFAYMQAEWTLPRRWIVEAGVRVEGWSPDSGDVGATLAPRFAVKRFLDGGETAIKASLGRYTQSVHSLRDEELPLGIDIWVLAGERAPLVVSDQVQIGIERFFGSAWFATFDAFYRSFDGVITNNLADDPNDPLDDLLAGRGRGYGGDLFIERSEGRVTGSLSLSWLRADRTFPDFRSGLETAPEVTYAPIFDRRLDADLVLRFPLPRAWEGGLRWHVGTGLPYTRPLASFAYLSPRWTSDGRLRWEDDDYDPEDPEAELPYAVVLGPRNGERYPLYHRLDLSARKEYRRSWGTLTPYLDVLNLYNRSNVLFYFYDFEATPPVRTGLSMFPLLPTLGVEVRF